MAGNTTPEQRTAAAEAKRRQRERNKAAAEARGEKQTRSGSSGRSALVLQMGRRTWKDVGHEAEHATDAMGQFLGAQMAGNGTMMLTLGFPMEYLHQAAVVADAGSQPDVAVFIRVYAITPESMQRAGQTLDD